MTRHLTVIRLLSSYAVKEPVLVVHQAFRLLFESRLLSFEVSQAVQEAHAVDAERGDGRFDPAEPLRPSVPGSLGSAFRGAQASILFGEWGAPTEGGGQNCAVYEQ